MEPTRQEFLYISQPEKYLFYALIYLSIAVMVYQVWKRSRLWVKGKPIWWASETAGTAGEGQAPAATTAKPTLQDVRRWTGNIWNYVVLQRKVRSSRKKSGAPDASHDVLRVPVSPCSDHPPRDFLLHSVYRASLVPQGRLLSRLRDDVRSPRPAFRSWSRVGVFPAVGFEPRGLRPHKSAEGKDGRETP